MNKKTETQVSDGQSDEYLVNLGQRIKDVREGKGMNVVNICFVTDLAVGTISNIERGKNVSYVTLHKILLALKSPPDEILPPDDHDILPIEVTISEDETQKYLDLVNAFQKTSEPLSHLIRKLHLASEHDIADGKEATAAEADPREPVVRQLGERIRDIRLARQMSVSELGAASGHQTPAMQLIEIGLRKPSIESLRRIAAALKVATADLFPGLPNQKEIFNSLRTLGLYSNIQSVREQVEFFNDSFNALGSAVQKSMN
ncbi:helix-turn-helix domain-containing protein [Gluconobacter sp. P5E10]|uniref:helix-turn-helix domain-containing protein n=1 Tax=Gluconobacter TaxID=441 RepID=UPI001C04E913|nr:helix-turn-helix transcriptional regulator [Gluconobacter sp. P5E10]